MTQQFNANFIKYEFNSEREKTSSLNEYLEIIRAYLNILIDCLK